LRLRSESSTACITTSYTSTVCSVQVIEIDSWGCVLDSGTTWITSALLSSHIIAFRFIDCSALVGLSLSLSLSISISISISISTQVRPDFDLSQTHWSRASKPSAFLALTNAVSRKRRRYPSLQLRRSFRRFKFVSNVKPFSQQSESSWERWQLGSSLKHRLIVPYHT